MLLDAFISKKEYYYGKKFPNEKQQLAFSDNNANNWYVSQVNVL